ncbi:uncharacterized protein I206_106580 [Kwoniella pini CBS 10737]|uniref:BTB domain-containing protein n=1 Tax=Kwoniella pini CBS 10737 TaxID=1296096 RepID=A0A1B9HTS8_9TREE|nr:uncharacterized protein I206_07529 [Kwoniella pini CBS 10737]OCF46674.1 hypothetical protein I206_07529 [Kwoniella pini CBS 10737]
MSSNPRIAPPYGENTDFVLISSDGMKFEVHSHMLKAASSVLRDMLETCQKSDAEKEAKLELSDKQIESSSIIALFLKIIYGKDLKKPSLLDFHKLQQYDHLNQLIMKYDASYALQHIKTCFRLWFMQEGVHADHYFLYACTLDDLELAKMVISSGPFTAIWLGEPANKVRVTHPTNNLSERNIMDIGGWDISRFNRVPDDYKFAFFRAEREASRKGGGRRQGGGGGKIDYEDMGRRFHSTMLLLRNLSPQ